LASRCVEIATGLAPASVLIALPSGAIERGLVELAIDSLLDAISSRSAAIAVAQPTEPAAVADSSDEPALESQPEEQLDDQVDEPQKPRQTEPRWWVVADESVVTRLRRVRSGPPRAARGGPSLHT
jgi:hypothetical protein